MSCCCDSDNFDPSGGSGAGIYSPPEQWATEDVAADLVDVVMSAQVSMSFDDIKMIHDGSIVGLATRFSETITAGNCTITVFLNGVATAMLIAHDNATNQNGGIATAAQGAIPYVATDLIGLRITTDAGFLPITTDVEAWIQLIDEA